MLKGVSSRLRQSGGLVLLAVGVVARCEGAAPPTTGAALPTPTATRRAATLPPLRAAQAAFSTAEARRPIAT